MNLDQIVYSTKSITLREMIIAQRVAQGEASAIVEFLLLRTNLTEEQALDLDLEDITVISNHIQEAIKTSQILESISKQLGLS